MAAYRGISHCYQRPTYKDWPYSIFTMAHGRSKEECDAILDVDRRRDRDRGARDAVLEHRVQEGPDALLHRRLPPVGGGARLTTSLTDTRSAELYRRALHVLPGGVNSPVRAMRSIGRDPIFIDRAAGAEITDVDGNVYVDYVCSWGPLIHGHAHPTVLEAIAEAAALGTTFGAATAGEVELAELVAQRMPGVDMLRMTSSGTEASMSAIRVARAATGRDKLLKFAGAYHGHVDGLLAEAGSGLATQGIPSSPGVPEAATAATVVVPWNDSGRRPRRVRRARVRRGAGRAVPGQHGPRPAGDGLPRAAARAVHRARHAAGVRRGDHRLPRLARRRAGAVRRHARPHRDGQGDRRRAPRRGLRRLEGADGAGRAGRERLPGGHAEREPARGRRRRAPRSTMLDRGGLPRRCRTRRWRSPTGCARRPARVRCRSRTRPGC